RIDPVADAPSRRNVPFISVTGYNTAFLPEGYAERPRLCKPFKMADLIGPLSRLLHAPAAKDR
ncbi:MAG: hypothetical protein WA633_20675, partial [Stellaceae bacterium]